MSDDQMIHGQSRRPHDIKLTEMGRFDQYYQTGLHLKAILYILSFMY